MYTHLYPYIHTHMAYSCQRQKGFGFEFYCICMCVCFNFSNPEQICCHMEQNVSKMITTISPIQHTLCLSFKEENMKTKIYMYIYMHICDTYIHTHTSVCLIGSLCYTTETNTVNQLYFIKKE